MFNEEKIKIVGFFSWWNEKILWGGMSCSPDQLHLFLPVGPWTCCWLWAVGRAEKSRWGENNQNPNWIQRNKTLQASGEAAAYSHHPKLSTEQLAFHLQQVASSPHACAVLRHRKAFEMTRAKEKKGLGFQVLFLLKKRKEEGKK